jgi:hypothetical protein
MLQYEVHSITTASKGLIREYVSRTGIVFAVTWRGPTPPNLRQLFGAYFEPFQKAAAARLLPGNHRQLRLDQSDFVVQVTGRLRAFAGRAYVPSLIPRDVSIADLP